MKKIASVFCACLAFAFFASGAGAQEKSLEAKNAELQAQVAQLEAKVKELEKQLVDQVEKDMKILGRLRAENRELKGQIRKIRMDEAVAAQASTSIRASTMDSSFFMCDSPSLSSSLSAGTWRSFFTLLRHYNASVEGSQHKIHLCSKFDNDLFSI